MKWIVNILDEKQETGAWLVGPFATHQQAINWAANHAPKGMWVVDQVVTTEFYLECN